LQVFAGFRFRALVVSLCTAAVLVVAPSALANTYTPTKLSDHPKHGFTLREAIIKANQHVGADRIVLRGGATYELSKANPGGNTQTEDLAATGDLDVQETLTIVSSNNKLATVDANRIDRVFEIDPTSNGGVRGNFKRIAVRHGKFGDGSGAGISYHGSSGGRIVSSVVSNNNEVNHDDGGGIFQGGGSLTITRSRISGNKADGGGGIEAGTGGTLSIVKSTVSDNFSVGDGGGVDHHGTGLLKVNRSTFSGNVTEDDGGGIDNDSTAKILNSTFTKNRAHNQGGAIDTDTGNASTTLNAVTVARNVSATGGGGIAQDNGNPPVSVANSIIALNSAPSGKNCEGTFVSGGHNLLGSISGCTGFSSATNDRVNKSSSQVDLGSLANNGGPTKTIALLSGSLAINHAGSSAPSRDQRGHKRNDPDIGAFERG
jgi:hypothetical protein